MLLFTVATQPSKIHFIISLIFLEKLVFCEGKEIFSCEINNDQAFAFCQCQNVICLHQEF